MRIRLCDSKLLGTWKSDDKQDNSDRDGENKN